MSIFILYFGMILSILIRLFFILSGLDVADILKAHQVAKAILQGNNPYKIFNFATYPPLNYYQDLRTKSIDFQSSNH